MISNCKSALDFATWSNWLVFFRLGTASSTAPEDQTAPIPDSSVNVGVDLTTYMMKADAKLNNSETKESNWWNELAELDPINPTLYNQEDHDFSAYAPLVGQSNSALTSIYPYIAPINGWRLAFQLVSMASDLGKVIMFYNSNFYYYNLARHFCKLFTTLFVMIDHVGRLGVIVPTPVYNRYRNNA